MKQGILILTVLGLMSLGCNNNKAAEKDSNNSNSSTNQPPASAAAAPASSNSNSDQDFVAKAAKGNREEVTLGKMVAAKTKDPNVRQFAQMMVKDHTQALNELQQLAQSKNITLPEGLPDDASDLQSKLSSDNG